MTLYSLCSEPWILFFFFFFNLENPSPINNGVGILDLRSATNKQNADEHFSFSSAYFYFYFIFYVVGPFLLPCYQLGSQPSTAMFHSEENGSKGMDPLVLIDAIAICMAYEEKELCKIGEVALAVIFDVASIILGSKERVSRSFCSTNLDPVHVKWLLIIW